MKKNKENNLLRKPLSQIGGQEGADFCTTSRVENFRLVQEKK